MGEGGWLKKLPTVFNCCENTVYSRTRSTVKIFIYSTALLKFYISTTIALKYSPERVSVLTNVYRGKLFPVFHHWTFLMTFSRCISHMYAINAWNAGMYKLVNRFLLK